MSDRNEETAQTGLNAFSSPATTSTVSNDESQDIMSLGLQLLAGGNAPGTDAQQEAQRDLEALKPHVDNIEAFLEHVEAQGHTRSHVFRDWIDMMLAALQGNEETYQDTIERYTSTTRFDEDDDRHPISQFSNAMGDLMAGAEKAKRDLLGEVYMTFGEQADELAQHFTPHSVADMMAASTLTENPPSERDESDSETEGPLPGLTGMSIADPACGSGRLLLGMARQIEQEYETDNYWVYGRDLDPVCAKMTVLNLYFHGVNGVVVHGDTLRQTAHNAWGVLHDDHGSRIRSLPAEAFANDITEAAET